MSIQAHTTRVTNPPVLPSREAIKAQAKRLRATLAADGNILSHSEALELLARQHAFRDWNTMSAAIGNRPAQPLVLGQKVTGLYLGQPFKAEVIALAQLNDGARYRITLDLDEPVDVVTFDSFSALRKRINATIGRDGRSWEKTSNGRPQLQIRL
jgi:hypothetical protein